MAQKTTTTAPACCLSRYATNKAIHEVVANQPTRGNFNQLLNTQELKRDVKVIKAAVTDLRHQATDHEYRITDLETKAA